MRTNVKNVYSAGDCAQVYHKVMEENAFIPLGTNANKCGRIAGANIAGQHQKYVGTLGSAAIKVCDLEMGRTGLSEFEAQNLAIDYTTVFVQAADHPGYYPNQTSIWIKLICEKRTKRILGAQAIGHKGAVLRIDIFAVAIHNQMSADELGMTDLVYAPPFAGVWDAVHIACNAVK
jgi:NADPH-dependent 2,4-dienoyl-CoA reductase/sulfur reductase-like enzyme